MSQIYILAGTCLGRRGLGSCCVGGSVGDERKVGSCCVGSFVGDEGKAVWELAGED